jgi:hypothetical protein
MVDQPGKLDESAIKAAARRAWSEQRAPEDLRRNIAAIALAARPAHTPFRIAPRPLAAAVILVLGIGSVVFQIVRLRPVTPQLPNHYPIPSSLMAQLEARHDSDSDIGNVGGTDLSKVAGQLSAKFPVPVMSTSPGPEYHFEGASIFTLANNVQAAHLLFKHGPESLSVFSMPADDLPQKNPGARYDGGDATHSMSGFVKDGAFYCVTASGPNSVRCNGMVSGAMQELSSKSSANK